ncbi:MAG: TraR/DksA C4-type zinc finger protein [Betaproteobacteria bacterium]|nr:TraR/DksA C4-type zinc finger protein [Betaproteobacteria bacterium]
MDEIDRAQRRAEEQLADALAEHRRLMPQGESAKWCEMTGCGERIPEERRAALPGVRFCVDCQAHLERLEKTRK